MSLISLAIIGKDNEPLYLRDFQLKPLPSSATSSTSPSTTEENNQEEKLLENDNNIKETTTTINNEEDEEKKEENDPFGFFSCDKLPGESSSLRHQFLYHTALDIFDELLNISTSTSSSSASAQLGNVSGGGLNTTSSVNTNFKPQQSTTSLLGSNTTTSSNTGNVVSDSMWIGLLCPLEEMRIYGYLTNTNMKFMTIIKDTITTSPEISARETELKLFFTNIHQLYVEYMLNPFSNIKTKIISKRFDVGLQNCVNICNKKYMNDDDNDNDDHGEEKATTNIIVPMIWM